MITIKRVAHSRTELPKWVRIDEAAWELEPDGTLNMRARGVRDFATEIQEKSGEAGRLGHYDWTIQVPVDELAAMFHTIMSGVLKRQAVTRPPRANSSPPRFLAQCRGGERNERQHPKSSRMRQIGPPAACRLQYARHRLAPAPIDHNPGTGKSCLRNAKKATPMTTRTMLSDIRILMRAKLSAYVHGQRH